MSPTRETVAVNANRIGALSMVGAMACFIVNDALVKYVSESLPAAQLIFVRSAMATVLVLAIAAAMGATARFAEMARGWVLMRAIVDALATILYLWSLFHLPIANATAINMTSPLIITALAAALLGEYVGAARAAATGVGFVGVLLIVQPRGVGFNVFALVCFMGTILIAIRDLMTQRVHGSVPSILLILSTFLAVTIFAGTLSAVDEWRPFDFFQLALLGIAALFLAAAYYLTVMCTRTGDFSFIAPFRYSGLLFAALAGYWLWGDVPNAMAWCGVALLIGSGIYILRVSARAAKRVNERAE